MHDRPLVGGDGMGSVLECSADVVDGWLPILHVKRSCLEENVSVRRRKPLADIAM